MRNSRMQYLEERWPETEWDNFEAFMKQRKEEWREVDASLLKSIHRAYKKRWSDPFLKKSRTKEALIGLCDRRLGALRQ